MLPMLVTSILAMAATNMAKRNALIRRLPAAETLGCTTVICSDKTGTLTRNEMTVLRVYAGGNDYRISGAGYDPHGEFTLNEKAISSREGHDVLFQTLTAGFRCSNAALIQDEEGYHITGDPTEGALVVAAAKAGITERGPRLDEVPFESEQMFMAALYGQTENNIIYVKGAPEKILSMCLSELTNKGIQLLRAEEIRQKANEMAQAGLRILGIAYKNALGEKKTLETADVSGLVFLGLEGMADPPREEVVEAIQRCKRAGIRTIMITGDHALTAKAIASQLGMQTGENGVVTGEELSRMSDEELGEALNTISIFARVSPEHKLRIAQQLQEKGQIVAMTGDGVNDAPALRAANIGIAMGKTGTDVSKGASAMVLTDDNFASIVAAVEEGRHAWNNLEIAILYTLPTNGGQALLVMGAILLAPFIPLLAMRLPLEPIQILWVNLFDSVFLTMPLMMEPREKGLLDMPPRNPNGKIANGIFFERVGLVSLLMAAVGIAAYWYFGHSAISVSESLLTQAQTAALMSVVMFHCGYVITARSIYKSAFFLNPFSNKWLLAGIMVTLITNLMIVYIPFMNSIFRTVPFPAGWWPYMLLGIPAGFLPLELEKLLRRKLKK
jgi:magnesium-transporting ATPase (P-type)